ncbi:MAG: hypothetical protein M3178_10605 [Pseudomonadota bacterium]|nr:hypothetical protein [Pseudomonadota bacterium]
MTITFTAASDFQNSALPAPAPETFSFAGADITAFPRLFPYSLTEFKTGLSANAPGFNMGDKVIQSVCEHIIQVALVGGGASIAAAATRAGVIARQTVARQLVTAILADAGA